MKREKGNTGKGAEEVMEEEEGREREEEKGEGYSTARLYKVCYTSVGPHTVCIPAA